jgi:hypothetical protein
MLAIPAGLALMVLAGRTRHERWYCRDSCWPHFVKIQTSLAGKSHDALDEYIQHVGSGLFAWPPGVAPGQFWGRAPLSGGRSNLQLRLYPLAGVRIQRTPGGVGHRPSSTPTSGVVGQAYTRGDTINWAGLAISGCPIQITTDRGRSSRSTGRGCH